MHYLDEIIFHQPMDLKTYIANAPQEQIDEFLDQADYEHQLSAEKEKKYARYN